MIRYFFLSPVLQPGALEIGHLRHRRTRLTLTRRFAPPSPTRRGRTIKGGCGSDRRFMPCRYHCVMQRLFVILQVSTLVRGPLPRPWGEGGRRPGEGQPTGIAPQNVQTPECRQGSFPRHQCPEPRNSTPERRLTSEKNKTQCR